MYFKEKEDTNIDSEFEKGKKFSFNFDFNNLKSKPMLLIIGGIVLLLIIILIIAAIIGSTSNKYTLELLGEETVVINVGEDYIEPGYTARDKKNNDVSNEVEITSNVDRFKVGNYEILYSLGDKNIVRYVSVVEGNKETYIYLKGDMNMYLKVGSKYTEPGYTVYDSIDADLTSKVVVSGTVDTSKKGMYQITYSVTNSRNATTSVKRIVVVE